MDAIKNAVGLGQKNQEGVEPVSGSTGSGTVQEPYDAGNKEEATQAAVDSPAQSNPATSTTATGTSESATSAPKQEPAASSEPSAKPTIGSPAWFKTAVPSGERKQEEASTTSARPEQSLPIREEREPDASSLPPNVLSRDVPSGHSTDISNAPSSNADITMASTTTSNPVMSGASNPDVVSASADGVDTGAPSAPGSNGPPASTLPGTHSSIAQPRPNYSDSPLKPADGKGSGRNESAIPTAGGEQVGAGPGEERRRSSRVSQELSGMSGAEATGDEATRRNTAANLGGPTDPTASSTAPTNTASTGGPTDTTSSSTAPTDTKDNTAMSGASDANTGADGEGKKGGKMHDIKEKVEEKLHIHGKGK